MAKRNVDDKWAWAVCMGSFWAAMFTNGVVRSSGIFFASIVEQWGLSREEVSWPFNLCMALDGFGVFLAGVTGHKFIIRRGLPIAELLFFSGYALSSLTKNVPLLTLLIGLIGGLSQGYVVGSCYILMCHYFIRFRTIATGISLTGPSIGGITFPYLCNYLIEEYGLSGSFLIVGGVSLQSIIGVMLCRFVSLNEGKLNEEQIYMEKIHRSETKETISCDPEKQDSSHQLDTDTAVEGMKNKRKCLLKLKPINLLQLTQFVKEKLVVMKHPVFYIYALSFTTSNFCVWSWTIIIVDFAKDRGLTQSNASYLLSVISISDIFGCMFYGWLIDFGIVKKRTAIILLFFLLSLNSFLMVFFSSFVSLCISSACFGFLIGCFVANRAIIPAAYFGVEGMPSVIALTGLLITGVSLLRPSLIGIIRDKSGSYNTMFLILGSLLCVGGVMWLFEPLAMRFHKRKIPSEQTEDDI